MSDLLQVSDLERAKLHDTFHSEVITGKVGGLAGGADIELSTNQVTGQVQKTLPKILSELDWSYVGLFADGVTFTKRTDFALDSAGIQWVYVGAYPFTATAGTVPTEPIYQVVHVRDHNSFSNRNAVDAHDAAAITTVSNGTMQQFVDSLKNKTLDGIVYGDNGAKYRVISAVIRNSGLGWFIIDDEVHTPTGLQSVSVEPDGTIRLTHNVGANVVGSLLATVDETFAKYGIIVGGSIGNGISFLQLSAPLEFTVNTSSGVLTKSSFYGADITASVSAGQCTVNHPALTLGTGVCSANTVGSATKTDFNISTGATQIVIDAVGDADGYIRFDGANWIYSGEMRVAPAITFASGELTVTHEEVRALNISAVARDDGYRVAIGSISATSFKVKFYNSSGSQVTSVDTSMKFYFSRAGKINKNLLSGSLSIKRGYIPLKANNVISTTGNVWLLGLMRVE